MVNESTSLIRRIFWMISIGVAGCGFLLMVSVDLESNEWLIFELAGFGILMLGAILTIIFNDPVAFIAAVATSGIVFNYMLYKVFKLHTKTLRRCYRLMKKHDNSLYDVYTSAYDAVYSLYSIEPIVYRED